MKTNQEITTLAPAPLSTRAWMRLVRRLEAAERVATATPWAYESDLVGHTAYRAAKAELTEAREDLAAAMYTAPWGRQDVAGTFMADRRMDWGDSRVRVLFVCRRGRAVLEYNRRGPERVYVVPRRKADGEFKKIRALRAQAAKEYAQELGRLARDIADQELKSPRSFSYWHYCDGQRGGCFVWTEGVGVAISAPGAFKAAKKLPPAWSMAELEVERKYFGARY